MDIIALLYIGILYIGMLYIIIEFISLIMAVGVFTLLPNAIMIGSSIGSSGSRDSMIVSKIAVQSSYIFMMAGIVGLIHNPTIPLYHQLAMVGLGLQVGAFGVALIRSFNQDNP